MDFFSNISVLLQGCSHIILGPSEKVIIIWTLEIRGGKTASFSKSDFLVADYYSFAGVQDVIIQLQLGVKLFYCQCRIPNGRYMLSSLMQSE